MQMRQSVRGRYPVIPALVMITIAKEMAAPIAHANRFGLAETHSAG